MEKNRIFPAIVAVVIAGSFAAGVMEPELRAQGLPEVLSSMRTGAPSRELDPTSTYNKVLQVIRDRYYGETQPELRMTYQAISGLLNSLDDPYTRFLDPEGYRGLREENSGEFEGIGAQLSNTPTKEGYIRIFRPLPNGPASRAGVRKGDLIMKVDGKSVQGMQVDDAVKIIRGKAGTIVKLTIQRAGEPKPLEVAIERAPVEFEIVHYSFKDEKNKIGYISLAQFNEMADPKIEQAYRTMQRQGMKGLILDLRGNPGGLLDAAIDISSRFIPAGRDVVIIVEAGGEKEVRKTVSRKYLQPPVPLVVLINRTSASASEIVAGAIKDNKAGTIVGTTTFGKGLVQTVVPLSNGSASMITTAKYLNPSGRDINRSRDQRGGVEPDVPVEITEEEFLAGKDPQLQKAIDILVQQGGRVPGRSTE
jgi:carboxyl-terminal processing protease